MIGFHLKIKIYVRGKLKLRNCHINVVVCNRQSVHNERKEVITVTTGEKIQKLRKASGMSQEQLADKIAVSRQAVSRWELDESRPDTENTMRLGKLFKVSTDYLLQDEIEDETDMPVVKQTSRQRKTRHTITITSLLVIFIVVAVVSIATKTLHLAMAAAAIAFFGLIGGLLYLTIRFLRSFFR